MTRRPFLAALSALGLGPRRARPARPRRPARRRSSRCDSRDAEWKQRLAAAAYRCCATKAPSGRASSPLNEEKRKGRFVCAGCDLPLFSSDTKFESGTGWPSF